MGAIHNGFGESCNRIELKEELFEGEQVDVYKNWKIYICIVVYGWDSIRTCPMDSSPCDLSQWVCDYPKEKYQIHV